MDLVFDIGNTRTKWASFVKGEITEHGVFLNTDHLPSPLKEYDRMTNVLVCSVSENPSGVKALKEKFGSVMEFDSETPIPVRSEYKTPSTLGMDRSANAVAAHSEFPGQDIMVVDAGTCITVDLITSDGIHKGGIIAPGLNMRLKALNNYTSGLPLVQLTKPEQVIGQTTAQSILSGVLNGTIAEMNGLLAHFQEGYPQLKVVLTGGDLRWFEHVMKSKTFADPFFTLKGLHAILEYNS